MYTGTGRLSHNLVGGQSSSQRQNPYQLYTINSTIITLPYGNNYDVGQRFIYKVN